MGCALCKPTTTTTRRRGGGGTSATSQKDKKIQQQQQQQQQSNNSKSFDVDGVSGDLRSIVGDPFGPTNEFGWPLWLADVVGDVINSFSPRRATSFQKLDKIGQGTYSNVYKARDLVTGKIVALKKVRFDRTEPEGVKFMAREIIILCRLNHPNVIKLQGLVTSRMSSSVYLIFDYMEHDLSGLFGSHHTFTLPQIKCYMKQLFSGLEHCHNNGVLHRDIKGSNLLIDNEGNLKIADFGLATCYDPRHKQPMTSRVVTLWYRPPELLLGATFYGIGVDLWSAGCILAELLGGKPILPGRTEVEQLHKIFKLCGSPIEDYWRKYKLPNATLFKPQQPYKRCVLETFKDFPPSSLPLLDTLLSIDPERRPTATDALNSEFFSSEPYACEPSSLPKYSPSKEMDVKLRSEGSRRQRSSSVKTNDAYGSTRVRMHDRVSRGIPAPEANAELQSNIDRIRLSTQANAKAKSVKFPPPHQDGRVGVLDTSNNGPSSFGPTQSPLNAQRFEPKLSKSSRSFAPSGGPSNRKRNNRDSDLASPWKFIHAWKPWILCSRVAGLPEFLVADNKYPTFSSFVWVNFSRLVFSSAFSNGSFKGFIIHSAH